ncbi:MAG TPA: dihydrofolate reductase family protein [Aggregatilineaceae bacterium]|nr:dihydrofolate reductase family protein [Aggregatilineaceae bacterium]
MGRVILDITVSLDGFVAGPNVCPEHPLGESGMRLLDWHFSDDSPANSIEEFIQLSASCREILEETAQTAGARVTGRRTYDIAGGWIGEYLAYVPHFVLTHHVPARAAQETFVTDGIASAVNQARAAAGDKHVIITSPSVAQQCLQSGLLDEIQVHLVPVLLGDGVRLFDCIDYTELECTRVIAASDVTHLTYCVLKP